MQTHSLLYRTIITAWVSLILGFLILPNFIVIPISFSPSSILQFPPHGFSLQWYDNYIHQQGWLSATWNSIRVGFLVMIVSVIIGSLAAYGLTRGHYPGKRLINALVLFPVITPTIIIAVAIYKLFSDLHLTGTVTGFVIAHSLLAIPFVINIMTATLKGIDPVLENAARSLGATRLKTLQNVTLPLAVPGMMASAFFAFLISFDELIIALFISSPELSTLPKEIWDGIRLEIDPTIAAVSTILVGVSIIVLIMAMVARKLLEKRIR